MAKWQVTALDTGTSIIEKSILTYFKDVGTDIRIPRVIYVIEEIGGAGKKIVVDTSGESVGKAREVGEHMSRVPGQEVAAALASIGVAPEDVDMVINTHLHWDHCGNNALFPNAEFVVQKRELRYALAPAKPFRTAYLSPLAGFTPPYLGCRFTEIDGDVELFPGLTVMLTPGHSIGHQSIVVEVPGGTLCLAQDAVFTYENLEHDIPPGFCWRLEEAVDSMARIRRLTPYIVPGHDYRVFEQDLGCEGFRALSAVAGGAGAGNGRQAASGGR